MLKFFEKKLVFNFGKNKKKTKINKKLFSLIILLKTCKSFKKLSICRRTLEIFFQ